MGTVCMFKELQSEALELLNGYVKQGKTVVITGETGERKTTLLKELLDGINESKNVIIIALMPEEFEGYSSDNLMIWNEKRYDSSTETSKVAAKYNPDIVCHDGLRSDGVSGAVHLWLTGHSGLATITANNAETCLRTMATIIADDFNVTIEKGNQEVVAAVDVVVEMDMVGFDTRIAGIYEVDKEVENDIVLRQVYDKEGYVTRPVGESREGVFNDIMEAALKGGSNLVISGKPGSGKVHHTQPNAVGSGKGVLADALVQGIEDAKDSPYGKNRELTETEIVDDGKGGLDFKTSKLK
nr:CpaF/VirB11 family protein [Bacillus paranthracis]